MVFNGGAILVSPAIAGMIAQSARKGINRRRVVETDSVFHHQNKSKSNRRRALIKIINKPVIHTQEQTDRHRPPPPLGFIKGRACNQGFLCLRLYPLGMYQFVGTDFPVFLKVC